jgi:hypothetical protein
MTADEPSLSDHEQRILEEIEKNLTAEDPDFVRQVSQARPVRDAGRLLRICILGLVVGLGLLLANNINLAFGVVGFLVMLGSAFGIATSVRNLGSHGRSPGSVLRGAWKRAEHRMRSRRRDS